jgi:ParB family transcriptional regulator, chromosome partitioning protein
VTRVQQGDTRSPRKAAATTRNRDMERLEEELSDSLGAIVTLQADGKGRGKLVIGFSTLDQLDGILARLRR